MTRLTHNGHWALDFFAFSFWLALLADKKFISRYAAPILHGL